jgi:hypothetical protein
MHEIPKDISGSKYHEKTFNGWTWKSRIVFYREKMSLTICTVTICEKKFMY